MSKFCSNCGSPLNGNFCSNCGAKVSDNTEGLSVEASNYINQKIESKQNRNGYRVAVGTMMIVLGALIFLGSLDEASTLKYELIGYDITLGFRLPGIAALVGGILSIVSKNTKYNSMLIGSGVCYVAAAICNVCGINDISLLFILCCIFAPVNFVFYSKTKKE